VYRVLYANPDFRPLSNFSIKVGKVPHTQADMSNKKLQLKYRPSTFSEIIGQAGIVKILRRSVLDIDNKMEQAAIFHGPYGSGKTTSARIVARSLLCTDRRENGDPCNECESCKAFFNDSHPGYVEIDGANITKVEDFRKILESTNYQVVGSQYRVYVVDECHMMSKNSQNLFLKPLEEGIPGVFWFFCTTEYNKIINTIRSRCVDYRIRPIPHEGIVQRVSEICEAEGIAYEKEAVEALVAAKKGHFRDVLVFIGKVRDLGGITAEVVYDYLDVGLNDTYFNVLSDLKDEPEKAMTALDNALLRVSAVEAYNGLAQAAMDAYKVGQGLRPALLVRNKDLPKTLSGKLGNDATRVSQYLIDMGNRRVDTNYLISTLLMLRERMQVGMAVAGSGAQVVVREVVREVAAPAPAPAPAAQATTPAPAPAPGATAAPAPTPTKKRSHRPVLTSLDDKARRKKKTSTQKVKVSTNRSNEDNTPLSETDFGLMLQRGF
jgi:DNA polymerase III subunit gamma/tau